MPPVWLTALAWSALGLAFVAAGEIVWDIFGRGCRQRMRVMEAVWPVTAVYFGPAATWAYRRFGRPTSQRSLREHGRDEPPDKPAWATTAVGVSHCGAGCTLGDILAGTVIFVIGATIAGVSVYAEMLGDYLAAIALGVLFQYLQIGMVIGFVTAWPANVWLIRSGIKEAM